MCGRYRLSRRKQLVEEYFGTDLGEYDWNPRYNIAPTQHVPVIRQHPTAPTRKLSMLRSFHGYLQAIPESMRSSRGCL